MQVNLTAKTLLFDESGVSVKCSTNKFNVRYNICKLVGHEQKCNNVFFKKLCSDLSFQHGCILTVEWTINLKRQNSLDISDYYGNIVSDDGILFLKTILQYGFHESLVCQALHLFLCALARTQQMVQNRQPLRFGNVNVLRILGRYCFDKLLQLIRDLRNLCFCHNLSTHVSVFSELQQVAG